MSLLYTICQSNTFVTITSKKAGLRSLADAWADTNTMRERLMLTVLGGLAEFEREAGQLTQWAGQHGDTLTAT
jgi:hypothetical protein